MNTPVQVDLYAAISLDGYIARMDGTTNWTKDDVQFEQLCREYKCIIMGRSTYDEFGGPAFDGIENLVLTHNTASHADGQGLHFVASPQEAVQLASELGFEKLLVIGGAETYAAFMQDVSVHTVSLDIHEIFLGEGLKLFGDYKQPLALQLQSVDRKDSYLHTTYSC
jgi:dihydrofolate reductase